MKALVMIHLSRRELVGPIRRDLEMKVVDHLGQGVGNVYNILNYSQDKIFGIDIFPHDKIVDIGYRQDRGGNICLQFLDAKKRMLDDGVSETEICGFYLGVCVDYMASLLAGCPMFVVPSLLQTGWESDLYEKVIGTVVHTRILEGLSR